MVPAGKSTADEKSRSLTPAGVHAYLADFAIIAGRAECNLRGDALRLYRVAPIVAYCARIALVSEEPLVIERPTCILTGDCLRAHALRQAGRGCRSDAFVWFLTCVRARPAVAML